LDPVANPLERAGDGAGVRPGVAQGGHVLVGIVADHQGDLVVDGLLGRQVEDTQSQQGAPQGQEPNREPEHRYLLAGFRSIVT
jgi:hypothetical protein